MACLYGVFAIDGSGELVGGWTRSRLEGAPQENQQENAVQRRDRKVTAFKKSVLKVVDDPNVVR